MLVWLTKAMRLRSAGFLAVIYLVCVLTPSAVFAFGDGTQAAHCLTDDHGRHRAMPHEHASPGAHVHADGTSHDHGQSGDAGKSDEKGAPSDGKCCGLFCVTALPAGASGGNLPDLPAATSPTSIERYATGQPPVRLDRPPNTPLSL